MFKKIKSLVISHQSLVIILIIASFLRLYNLAELPPGLYPDEAMNGNNAAEALETGNFKVFYPENFGREGLFINIQSSLIGLIKLIGPIGVNEPWVLRFSSAIFGILTVLGLYLFTKEFFKNKNLALLSAFLLATSFWHINFSRIGFRAIMAPAFLVWSLYFLFLSFEKIQKPSAASYQPLVAAAIGGLLYGLGFHSYIAYRATPLLILFTFYFFYKNYSNILKNIRIVFLVFSATAIITALPLGIYFLQNPQDFFGRTAGISIFNSPAPVWDLGFNILKTAGMFNIIGDFNWRHNIAGRPLLFWPVGLLFLVGLSMGLVIVARIVRGYRLMLGNINAGYYNETVFLLIWLIVAALPVALSNEALPHALRSLLMAPPVFILAAIGGMKIYEFLKSKLSSRLLSVVVYMFCSLLLFESYVTYFIIWGQNPNVKTAFNYNDYIIAGKINQLLEELPKYAILNEEVGGKIERDNPISLQTILFLTDTFTDEKRSTKNIFYFTPGQFSSFKPESGGIIIRL